jgi:hypothetical protein
MCYKRRNSCTLSALDQTKIKGKHIICAFCGTKFFAPSKGGGYPKYCSERFCEKQRDKIAREKKTRKRAKGKWSS